MNPAKGKKETRRYLELLEMGFTEIWRGVVGIYY